ncbi:LOW QUALITY PROTEIN: acylphosphatase-1 [Hyla sarda]|uniref:acylphosphatase-1-like n=1 Tax=Hyla sarda TaxID=327740 RepID=UPI0024C3B7EB|nr:acylphosphatase-1-like [Hyla sarda]XP_056408827.1 acylphosphatase-1-like [Hyla sarda]XP_056408828.1 acylphosphatase-1-like [Hyla sarda]XP_056408829.1 acylphosphatase-1-like [Hyla sarda]XP_056408830.1 acylphosphatase-1-like [Hyla sarda]XP_056409543.1 LOW QUALITY PROTEIN: acylphosphatase-1 [Hyla sarda]
MTEADSLISQDFEVFGKVQGVFFRKYTQAEGTRLGLVGWVQNTEHGTVKGHLQGPVTKVREMQQWLQETGSPKSRITRAQFHNEKKIQHLEHGSFQIRK